MAASPAGFSPVSSRAAPCPGLESCGGDFRPPSAGWDDRPQDHGLAAEVDATRSADDRTQRTTMTGGGEEHRLGIVTKVSPRSVTETVARLTSLVEEKGLRLFAVIDQAAEARQAGLELRETTLVLFGSPAAGTPVMVASPMAALDLPLKVLVWSDGEQTLVSYTAPAELAARHHLSPELAQNLAGIEPLTDALVDW